MKKVVLFVDNFYPKKDSIVNVVDRYARSLKENKIKAVVVAPEVLDRNGNPKFDDSTLPYKVVRCKAATEDIAGFAHSLPNQDEAFMVEVSDLVKNSDMVHIHTPMWLGRLGVELARTCKKPCIASFHKEYKGDFENYFGRDSYDARKYLSYTIKTFELCDEVWAVSKSCADVLYSYGYDKNREIHFVQDGTEMAPISDDIRRISLVQVNRTYEISPGDNVLVYAAKLIKRKNVDFIFDVMKELKNRNFSFKFLMVGEGPQRSNLENFIEENGLQKNIVMVGEVTDRRYLQTIMSRANLCVFPSHDISSVLPIEFASVSVPTLFIKGSSASSGYEDGYNAFMEVGRVSEFATKIQKLFTEDGGDLLKKVGRTARETVYKTWSELMKQVVIPRYEEMIVRKRKFNRLTSID